ncbi:MAG: Ig-like domain-containing protein [Bryobacteraceae bacterium]
MSAVIAVLTVWMAAHAAAGNVFVLPANTFDTSVAVLTENPFQSAVTLTVPPGVRGVFARPDGLKYYVVSGSSSDTILVMNSTLTSVLRRIDLGTGAQAAGLSPDGKRLLVLAGRLHVFDTTRADDDEITREAGLDAGVNPSDLAFALDSSCAFILSPESGEVVRYDLASNAIGSTVDLGASARAISMAPNGLLYVSATNVIYEVDPVAGAVRRQIKMNGAPGKGAFTPDGKYGLFPNSSAFIATGLGFLVNTETREVSVIPKTGAVPEIVLDQLAAADNTSFFGVTTNARDLVRITVNPLALARTGFPLAGKADVRGLATSRELPQVQYLFVSNGAAISRGSLATSAVEDRSLPVTAGRVVLAGAASTNPPTGGFYRFNDRQTLTGGATSQPLILRVWDAGGAPVFGKKVEFTTDTENVTFEPETTKTTVDGYAQTRVTVPEVAGLIRIAANVEGLSTPITFEITVAGDSGGGGTGGGLRMHSGNGQVVARGFPTELPLKVRLTNSAGDPIVGATVVWNIESGEGTVYPKESVTDGDGIAVANFAGVPIVPPSVSFVQTTISASVSGFNPVEFTMTTVPLVLGTGAVAKPLYTILAPTTTVIEGRAGQTLTGAIQVRVKALTGTNSGSGIPNVGVTLSSDADPATSPTANCVGAGNTALSDATGLVNCDLRFGPVIGGPVQVKILIAGGGSATGSAGAEYSTYIKVAAGPPSLFTKISGDGQTGAPGVTLQPLVAEISDGVGHVLPGTAVTWESLTPNTVTVVSSVNVADSLGRVNAQVRLGTAAGPGQIRVRAGSAEAVFNVTSSIPIASLAKISGDSQSAILNQAFGAGLVVEARDAQGQPVAGVPVNFTLVSGPAAIGAASATTGADGRASTTVTAGATAGAVVIQASAGQFTVTFNLSVSIPVSSLAKFSGDGQVAVVNDTFSAPLVVELRDGQGSPVSGAAVTFTVVSGSATVLAPSAVSGANGRASTTVRAGATSGAVVIRAASFTFTATFNLMVIPPGPVLSRNNIRSAISGDLGVTPGGITAIYGQGIAPDLNGSVVANGGNVLGPLPTTLAGVEVLFGSTSAPIYHVTNSNGSEWVVVQAPFSLTPGQPVSVTVRVGGGSTTVDGVEVKSYQPAIFESLGPSAQRWAVLTKEDGSYVTQDNPVRKGVDRKLRMYCSGLGQTNPALLTNGVGVPGQTLLAQLSLYILTTDGSAARVISAEPMAGVVGVYVVTIELPAALQTGVDKILTLGVAGPSGPFSYLVTSAIPRVE